MKVLLSSLFLYFLILVVPVIACAQSAAGKTYRDSQGRFVVSFPEGWKVEDLGADGVKFTHGGAYCNVTHMRGGASGADIVSQVLSQISAQWRNFNVVDQGETSMAGHRGSFATGVGTNPEGIPAVFKVSAVGNGSEVIAVLSSTPQAEFAPLKAALVQMERTVAFGGAATGGTAAATSPAIAEKLAALDAACRAGVLTAQECEAKRKALLRDGSAPASGRVPTESAVPAAGRSGDTVKFARISVKDPGINNIEAVAFLIPSGWRAEGGVQWFPDFMIQANLLMKIADPRTGAAIEFLPLQNFTWLTQSFMPMQPGSNYLGNIVWPPIMDLAQFIRSFYVPSTLRQLQNARLIVTEDFPKIAAQVAQLNGAPSARAGRVRYEYQINGQPWEEDVFVTLLYNPTQLGMLWSVTGGYSFRAPKGQLDRLAPVMNTTINTMRLSLEWYAQYQYVQKLFIDRMNQGIRNAGRLSETIARNNEEIRQMFADSYRRSCESQDRISRSYTEYIRGVETYRNPYEDRPIQLPSGYSQVWVNSSGEYILSNQAGFDPNVGSIAEWRRMERSP